MESFRFMDDKKDKKNKTSNVINIDCSRKSCCAPDRATDIFAESIKEEIQQENWQNLWKKYGTVIISVIAGLIIIFGIHGMWEKKNLEEREAISAKFTTVQTMLMSGDFDKAMSQLKDISHVDNKSYALLAKMEYAATLSKNNDKKALEVYKSIFDDQKEDVLFRNFSYILYVNLAIDIMDAKTLSAEIGNMINILSDKTFQEGPWNLIAKEALSYCYIKSGKNDHAKKILENLVKTDGIPEGIAERTRLLIQSLGE